ncbi:MAG: spondin domain-containing protein, partial [Candidatus Limnocylindria bacterium]
MTVPARRYAATILALLGLLTLAVVPAGASSQRTYEVTITNLTSGQALTPPLIATHRGSTHLFQVGAAANSGTQQIAENGNVAPLMAGLAADRGVWSVVAAGAPLVPEGTPMFGTFSDRVTLTIDAGPGAQFLSHESMLICTNDGFTGVDGLKLPRKVGRARTVRTNGYDAFTELNTEDYADIVPPCQGLIGDTSGEPGTGVSDPALAEGGVIAHHAGIAGGADLEPAIHGWTDPVAELTVV